MFYQEEGETLWVKDNFLFVFQLYLINEPVVVLAVLLSTDRTGAVRGSLRCMYGVEHCSVAAAWGAVCTTVHMPPCLACFSDKGCSTEEENRKQELPN